MCFIDLNSINTCINFDVYKNRASFMHTSLIFELKLDNINAY